MKKEREGKAKPKKNSHSYYREYPGSKCAVLFIHGIIEGPKQFRSLAEIAYEEGYSTDILLLPGHGGSNRLFADTDFKAWIRYVSREISRMKGKYEEVILVGHSMGALFCLCEAAAHQEGIKSLVLFDTPLKIHIWPRVIKGAYKIAKRRISAHERYVMAEYKAMSVEPVKMHSLRALQWAKRYLELFSIIRYTRKQIRRVTMPVLTIFARKDEFVSLKSERYLRQLEGKRLYLNDSGHFCYHHSDLIRLEQQFRTFLREEAERE